jgi:hypothetical protein
MRRRKRSEYHRFALRFALIAIALVVLLFPAAGNATHECPCYWHWGFNRIGPNTNNPTGSGWNYWFDQWVDKRDGGEVWVGWFNPSNYDCGQVLWGAAELYHRPTRCGWGGTYIRNILTVYNPDANWSYLFADSIT